MVDAAFVAYVIIYLPHWFKERLQVIGIVYDELYLRATRFLC